MIAKFNTYESAEKFSSRTFKASAIILGNDNLYWVVNLATMEKLIESGYELGV